MINNQRNKNLSLLKGILSGKRSISEPVRAEPLYFYHYDTRPGQYFISGRAKIFDTEKDSVLHANQSSRVFTESQYHGLVNDPRYTVTLIRIIHE